MNKISVFNRNQIRRMIPIKNTVLISLGSPHDPAEISDGWLAVHRVGVDDIEKPRDGYVAFSEDHAQKLIDFIDQHKECDFAVHCGAGMSRSPAVAVFIGAYLGSNDIRYRACANPTPNNLILSTLKRVAGMIPIGA